MPSTHCRILAALALSSGAYAAGPQATIEYLPAGNGGTDVSADGAVVAGNITGDGSYETFRWTAATGVVRLGRGSVAAIGIGGGSPDISHDGTRISASILSTNGRLTQGLWTLASDKWVETMPPLPPDGAEQDLTYGSAWGLSGDGTTVTGYYINTLGRAQPSTWSEAGGMVGLPETPGRSSRVDAANYDGTVVVGWEESSTGPRQPTAWRSGVKFRLDSPDIGGQAWDVSGDGSVVVGSTKDPSIATRVAAIWRWNGSSYDMQLVGVLPGTALTLGQGVLEAVTDDGSVAVGFNLYSSNPGGPRDAIYWSEATGLVKDTDYLAGLGLTVPPDLDVLEFNGITPDGRTILGIGRLNTNFQLQSFLIHLPAAGNPADLNGDGVVNAADLALLLGSWGTCPPPCPADLDGDGSVGASDLALLLGSWG